ncbi:MAG: acyl-CoA dehydrogenase family protein [Albidovulum sp.]|uniref:acyl-CoA dehydrogenase family protein n=1 Tax=Albidovulum sp. TaxID=1872424 RepID=UPI003C8D1CD8
MDLVKARAQARKASQSFLDRVDNWSQENLTKHVHPQDRAQAFDPEVLAKLRETGLLSLELDAFRAGDVPGRASLSVPADGMEGVAEAIRGLSRTDPAVAVLVHVHNALTVRCLLRFGTEAQKEHWLPRLAQDQIAAFAATEPQAGSDLSRITTELTEDPQGGYRLNGEKYWITNASEAGVFLVLARLGKGTACVLVPATAPGVSVGPRLDKMSMRASSTCAVRYDAVHLTDDDILGGPNGGIDVAMYGLVCGRIGIAAQMLGLAEGALRKSVDYAQKREAFGSLILNHQGVAFPLAQIRAEIASVELTMLAAARKLDTARSYMSAMELANIAKLLASQLAERAAGLAVETLGGNGVAEGHAVEKLYRDAKVGKIYEGTVNVLLRAIAANLAGSAT